MYGICGLGFYYIRSVWVCCTSEVCVMHVLFVCVWCIGFVYVISLCFLFIHVVFCGCVCGICVMCVCFE